MRLLNPWALAGLALIAAPIVAHHLARRPARRQPFPTLRFLPAATPRPVSRARLTDLGLLALRCVIVAGAAFALAQPLWIDDARARDLGRQIARAIVVDTSASMRRPSTNAGGGAAASAPPALERARADARALADEATVARIVESDAPATLVAGAAAWLATQPMRRELVIVSDFQRGVIESRDLVDVPADTGVSLRNVAASGGVPAAEPSRLLVLAGDSEARLVAAAHAAAATGAPLPINSAADSTATAILFPSYAGREKVLRAATPLRSPEAFAVFERVVRDPLVVESFEREGQRATDAISAVEATLDGEPRTVIVLAAPAGPSAAAAVIRAATIAVSPAWIPDSERTAETMPASEREALERPTPESATGQTADDSHGRWVWRGVLALLLLELVVRRRRRAQIAEEATDARAA